MTTAPPAPQDTLAEWAGAVDLLETQIRQWSLPHGWSVSTKPTDEILETDLPPYRSKVIRVEADGRWVEFEPTTRLVIGGAGRVDVYSPLHHLMMLRRAEEWPIVHSDWMVYASNYPVARTWNQEAFHKLVDTLFVDQVD